MRQLLAKHAELSGEHEYRSFALRRSRRYSGR